MGDRLLRVLTHISTHLDGDLDVAGLAARERVSRSHFSRWFASETGETPKAYIERLRLEEAAFSLRLREDSITRIAGDVGFDRSDVFSRAFRRRFACSPREYRRGRWTLPRASERRSGPGESARRRPQLRRRGEWHLAFLRHLGPYEDVPESLFADVAAQLDVDGPRVGIGHDSPAVTAPDKLRFDACILVPPGTMVPAPLGKQVLPAADVFTLAHIGSFDGIGQSWAELFTAGMAAGHELLLPAVERYDADPSTQAPTTTWLSLAVRG